MIQVNAEDVKFNARTSGSKLARAAALKKVYDGLLTVTDFQKLALFSAEELFGAKTYRYYEFYNDIKQDASIMQLIEANPSNICFNTAEVKRDLQLHATFSKLAFRGLSKSKVEFARAKSVSK